MRNRAPAIALLGMLAALMSLPAVAESRGGEAKRLDSLDQSESDFRVAVAAHRRGDLALAEANYLEAIREDESFVEAMVNLARVQLAVGEPARALHWLDRAERIQPHFPQVAAVRGVVALHSGDAALAMDMLAEANALMPGDADVRVNLGAALIEGGLPARAIGVLSRAVEADPDSPDALFNIGLAHDHAGKAQEAAFFYARFLELVATGDPDRGGVEKRIDELKGERGSDGVQFGEVLAVTSGPLEEKAVNTKEISK